MPRNRAPPEHAPVSECRAEDMMRHISPSPCRRCREARTLALLPRFAAMPLFTTAAAATVHLPPGFALAHQPHLTTPPIMRYRAACRRTRTQQRVAT